MYRFALIFPALILIAGFAQQSSNPPAAKTPTYAAIPVEATKQPNPVKYTPESLARAKKWWTLDCEMCHGKNGDGKGDTAKEMKLQIADFTDPATLKRSHRWRSLLHHQKRSQRYARRRSTHQDGRELGSGELRPCLR